MSTLFSLGANLLYSVWDSAKIHKILFQNAKNGMLLKDGGAIAHMASTSTMSLITTMPCQGKNGKKSVEMSEKSKTKITISKATKGEWIISHWERIEEKRRRWYRSKHNNKKETFIFIKVNDYMYFTDVKLSKAVAPLGV